MRIATYNVHGFTGYPAERAETALGGQTDPRRIAHYAAALARIDCDLIAIQEGPTEQFAAHLAARLGFNLVTFASPVRWPGHLLSRYRIVRTRTLSGSRHDAEKRPFSRSAGSAVVELARDRALHVFAVHLHPRDRELRAREAAALREELEAIGPHDRAATIVLGDFNCAPGEAIHDLLDALGFVNAIVRMHGRVLPTRDEAVGKERAVDHIYLGATLAGVLRAADVVTCDRFRLDPVQANEWANSDHQPVVAELELP